MKAPPTIGKWLLTHCAPSTPDSVLGDLQEEYEAGRSAGWYWRQVLIAIVTGSTKEMRTHPWRAGRAVATGWIPLLLFFGGLGDLTAEALANYGWGWTRDFGYSSGVWRPFHISAELVSYGGFVISTWAVARWYGMPMVLAYAGSILISLAVSAAIIASIDRPIPVPHTLFYLISPGLPYVWRSGFFLVPLVILTVGLFTNGKAATGHAGRARVKESHQHR